MVSSSSARPSTSLFRALAATTLYQTLQSLPDVTQANCWPSTCGHALCLCPHKLSPLQYPVQHRKVALVALNSCLCFISSVNLSFLVWAPPNYITLQKVSLGRKTGKHETHLMCSHFLQDHNTGLLSYCPKLEGCI